VSFFKEEQNIRLIEKICDSGVEYPRTRVRKEGKLEGKTFVFTGALEKFTRDEAKRMVENEGGKTVSSVSGKTSYVVAGEDAGSKLEKAKRLKVNVITEDEFIKLIGE